MCWGVGGARVWRECLGDSGQTEETGSVSSSDQGPEEQAGGTGGGGIGTDGETQRRLTVSPGSGQTPLQQGNRGHAGSGRRGAGPVSLELAGSSRFGSFGAALAAAPFSLGCFFFAFLFQAPTTASRTRRRPEGKRQEGARHRGRYGDRRHQRKLASRAQNSCFKLKKENSSGVSAVVVKPRQPVSTDTFWTLYPDASNSPFCNLFFFLF